MTRVQMTQAVAADYAEAMQVARRAKNALFLFLALVLLIQLGVFFTVRYVPGVKIRGEAAMAVRSAGAPVVPNAGPTTAPSAASADSESSGDRTTQPATAPATAPAARPNAAGAEHRPTAAEIATELSSVPFDYVIAATDLLGVILSIAMAAILFAIIMMVLVGKPRNLIGVSHVTGAFCWSILLVVLLFPWQSLLNINVTGPAVTSLPAGDQRGAEAQDMKIPGVLYTYSELVRDYDFPSEPPQYAILKWSRFVAFPALSLIILLMVQGRSSRGMRSAVGEAEVIMDVPRQS